MAVHLLLLNPFVAVKPCTLNIWNTYSIFDVCVIQLQARKEKKKVKLNRLSKQNKSVKSMHILLYPQRRGHEASRPQIPALCTPDLQLEGECMRPPSPGAQLQGGLWIPDPLRKRRGISCKSHTVGFFSLQGGIHYPSWCLVLSALAKHRSLRTKNSTPDSLAANASFFLLLHFLPGAHPVVLPPG